MDIAIRVPLFYIFDFTFNKLTAPIKPNITLFDVENSTWISTENSSFVNEEMEISLFNFDYTSNLSYKKIISMLFLLMGMVCLTRTREALIGSFNAMAVLFLRTPFSSIFDFNLPMDNETVFLIRFIFFAIISCFAYYQMRVTRRAALTKFLSPLAYCIFSTLNCQNIEFYLAKYISIFILIFSCVYPQKISFQDFFAKNRNRIKVIIMASAFYFQHFPPLQEWSGTVDEDGGMYFSRVERSKAESEAMNHGGTILSRVIVMTLLSTFFSFTVNTEVEEMARTENPDIIRTPRYHWKRFVISPACFFIFVVDKTLWRVDGVDLENRWSTIQIFAVMYFAGILFNFCETLSRSKQSLFKNHQPLVNVLLFTLCSAAFVLAFCSWKLGNDVQSHVIETRLIMCLGFYSSMISTLALRLISNGDSLVYILNRVEFCLKSLTLIFISTSLLLVCFRQNFDLFVFFGAIYFAFKLGDGVREFCSPNANFYKNNSKVELGFDKASFVVIHV